MRIHFVWKILSVFMMDNWAGMASVKRKLEEFNSYDLQDCDRYTVYSYIHKK